MEATTAITSNTNPPELFLFTGDWETYQEALYQIFLNRICKGGLTFRGLAVSVKRQPEYKGKHFAFWHLISEGEREEDRTPDLRRCERIGWVNWLISNCGKDSNISCWENKRKGQIHIVIWCEIQEYAVILAKRNGYFLLKTAYPVTKKRAQIFKKEKKQSQKA